jgi:hypothetical protein
MTHLTDLLEAKRKKPSVDRYERGTVVGLQTRQGFKDCVITGSRTITRGRRAGQVEYECAPMERTGKHYGFKVVGSFQFKKPRGKYTKAQVKAAVSGMEQTAADVSTKRSDKTERGRKALGDIDTKKLTRRGGSGTKIGTGDEVLVDYKSGAKWERVAFVNFKTGKVAIFRRGFKFATQDMDDVVRELMGRKPARSNKDIRYIHPDHITQVRRAST